MDNVINTFSQGPTVSGPAEQAAAVSFEMTPSDQAEYASSGGAFGEVAEGQYWSAGLGGSCHERSEIVKKLAISLEWAISIVSILVLAMPDARTESIISLLRLLLAVMAVLWVIRARQSGVLKMTPTETYKTASTRPRESFLTFGVIVLSFCALVFPAIH